MTDKITSSGTFRNYLLGELSQHSMERLEERLMTDAEAFEELNTAEEELIDDFVGGSLSANERKSFERFFLCTEDRRAKLHFAKALNQYVTAHAPRPPQPSLWEKISALTGFVVQPTPALTMALAAALLVLGPVGIWSAASRYRLERQLDRALALQESLQGEERNLRAQLDQRANDYTALQDQLERVRVQKDLLEEELGRIQGRRGAPLIATALLKPGLLRDNSEIKRITIRQGTPLVELKLDVGIDLKATCQAELYDGREQQILTQGGLAARASDDTVVVSLILPAQLLQQDSYTVRLLTGDGEPLDRYRFQVALQK